MESRRAAIEQSIRALLTEKLHHDCTGVPGNEALSAGLGFDSLALSDLAEAIEERFGLPVPNRMLPGTLTVDQLIDMINSREEAAVPSMENPAA